MSPPIKQPDPERLPSADDAPILLGRERISRWLIEQLTALPRLAGVRIEGRTAFAEIGLGSLEAVALVGDLEELLGRRLPATLLAELPTIDALAGYLTALSEGADVLDRDERDEISATEPAWPRDFARHPAYIELEAQLGEARRHGLRDPYFVAVSGVNGARTTIRGREILNFSSYNYLGLSGNTEVARAAVEAIQRMGTSASASRLASGEKPIHRELEREISEFLGANDAVVYVGGHAANMSTIACLVGPGDVVFHDAFAHDSILQGCKLSGARQIPFPHNDWQALDALLTQRRRRYRHALVVIEGVYSMDGDIPDLPRFIEVKERHGAWLMVDEAHSLGVIGATGRGIGEHHGVDPALVDIWMGTLSKSLASCGGYVAGSEALVKLLKYRACGFVYSAGMPPSNAAAALAALRVLRAEPERVRRLQLRAARFLHGARRRGLDPGLSNGGAVVPVMVGSTVACLTLAQAIGRRGVLAHPMVFPAVAEDAARLRFFITSEHTEPQIDRTLDVVAQEMQEIQPAKPISSEGRA